MHALQNKTDLEAAAVKSGSDVILSSNFMNFSIAQIT